jgi:DNA-binding beta-propeller fold protein YncE
MRHENLMASTLGIVVVALTMMLGDRIFAQAPGNPNSAPRLYRNAETWAKRPEGSGTALAVATDKSDGGVWVLDRCASNACSNSTVPLLQKFDASGNYMKAFGAGQFNYPRGLFVDDENNLWVTDEKKAKNGKGAVVMKFSSEGNLLMTLGEPGRPGDDSDMLNGPSSVAVAPSGDIYVVDSHGGGTSDRIVKFSKDGKFITVWGKHGKDAGEFDTLRGIALDSAGRVFTADRGNNRIQIFDPDGKFISEWKQFGRPSDVTIDKNDTIYVPDSQSNRANNPGFQKGVRIGSAKDGSITAFIPEASSRIGAPDTVAADNRGNIYAGFGAKSDVRRFAIKILNTGYARLSTLGGEDSRYGLYSYAILPLDSSRAAAFMAEIFTSTLPIGGMYANHNQLNILYIPLQKSKQTGFNAAISAPTDNKKLGSDYSKSFYDYQIATAILNHICSAPPPSMTRLCDSDLSRGPFIFTYAAPASRLESVPPPYLFVDLSDIHEKAFPEFISAFREQVKREDISDGRRIDTFRLRLLQIILTASDWLPGVQKAIADIVHHKD